MYSHTELIPSSSSELPIRFWNIQKCQKIAMELWGKQLGFEDNGEWENVSNIQLIDLGGKKLLHHYPSAHEAITFLENSSLDDKVKYWDIEENRLRFIEKLKKELHLRTSIDWSSVTKSQVIELGGRGFLKKGNLYEQLIYFFPNENWAKCRPALDPSFWNTLENQRLFLKFVAQYNEMDRIQELVALSNITIVRMGGERLLKMYPSKLSMLRCVFPDEIWPPINSLENLKYPEHQESYLKYIEKLLKLKDIYDWKNVETKEFIKLGGRVLLSQYGNLYQVLKSIYGDKISNNVLDVRPRLYPKSRDILQVKKEIIQNIWDKLGYTKMEDFYKLKHREMKKIDSRSIEILGKPREFLPEIFSDYPWEYFKFKRPYSFWKGDLGMHIKFMEYLRKKEKLKNPIEFSKYYSSFDDFKDYPGKRCFQFHYSFLDLLLFVYPFKKYDILNKSSLSFWNDRNNVESLLYSLSIEYELKTKFDWYCISEGIFKNRPGFKIMLENYNGIVNALKYVFPTIKWEESYFQLSNSISLRNKILQVNILHLFSKSNVTNIKLNYYVKEFDINVPIYFQNENIIILTTNEDEYKLCNDFKEKNNISKEKILKWKEYGYRLVIIPPWDNINFQSIRSRLISNHCTDIENKIDLITSNHNVIFLKEKKIN